MKVEKLMLDYYETFNGLPNSKPIVRNNIQNDAFAIVVLDTLYGNTFGEITNSPECLEKLTKIIVPPPDSGIDLVYEHDLGDEYSYDFIQVKYDDLPESVIRDCFSKMKRTINDFIQSKNSIQINLLNILNNTNLDSTSKDRCNYYVVHKGSLCTIKGIKENESVVTIDDLERILSARSSKVNKVPYDELKSDSINNFALYNDNAYLVNIRGYELACLANKYINTKIGCNILFGQNLRESLEAKAKPFYSSIATTITKEPEKFWYYNNGITIVADDINVKADIDENGNKSDKIVMQNFTIINGAQTTSALGKYLRENGNSGIEKLKKVFVFARLLEVVDSNTGNNIAIYNNTQNPITTRDMVAANDEQKYLHNRLLHGSPSIYMEIRRGQTLPSSPKILKHRRTQNDELAQLAFAGFDFKPFIAKDKKKSLFNREYNQDTYLINEYYDRIFYFSYDEDDDHPKGLLMNKSNKEIDELLFVKLLYKEANRIFKQRYTQQIKENNEKITAGDENADILKENNLSYQKQKDTSNVSLFYVIAYYYYLKKQFGNTELAFDVEKYYSNDDDYKDRIIESFIDIYLLPTVEIVNDLASSSANVPAWIRSAKSQEAFLNRLMKDCSSKMISLKKQVKNFESEFCINQIVLL